MAYLSDIEIAQSTPMKPITDIAKVAEMNVITFFTQKKDLRLPTGLYRLLTSYGKIIFRWR